MLECDFSLPLKHSLYLDLTTPVKSLMIDSLFNQHDPNCLPLFFFSA